jgi:DNA-binding MarR family transcriptional regulator
MSDKTRPPDPDLFRLFNEIGIIAQLSGTLFERVMPAGMTLAQFTVLNHFARLGGPYSPSQLASAFQVTKATMTSTLQKLEGKGLVSVSPDPKDQRGKLVAITEGGRAMRDQCLAAVGPELARLARHLDVAEAASLTEPLARLRQMLDSLR